MRRTPDRETILRLKAEGLSQREIARTFNVSDQCISWAIYYIPKTRKYLDTSYIPSRVIDYWRNTWRWNDEQVKEACMRYAKSVRER